VPIIQYDQQLNGRRVQAMGLGYTLSFEAAFPDNSRSLSSSSSSCAVLAGCLVQAAAPQMRLKCATRARNTRMDVSENGLANAWEAILRVLQSAKRKEEPISSSAVVSSRDLDSPPTPTFARFEKELAASSGDLSLESPGESALPFNWHEEGEAEDGTCTLPNGLVLHAHVASAREEIVFLYQEIFERECYCDLLGGIRLGEPNIIIDAGSFAVVACSLILTDTS
jgi:hypothetical protein